MAIEKEEPGAGAGRRFIALDGLRGVGACVVVIYHVLLVIPAVSAMYSIGKVRAIDPQSFSIQWWLQRTPLRFFWSGHEAVLVFFVLSGIVLTLPLVRASRPTDWRSYYVRRLARLYIPVWGALVFALLLAVTFTRTPALGSTWLRSHVPPTGSAIWHDFSLLLGTSNLDSPLWSLRWEVWFSILLPVMFWMLRVLHVGRHWRIAIPALSAVAALAVLPGVKSALPGAFLTAGLLQYMPIFAIGMVICISLDDIVRWSGRRLRSLAGTPRIAVVGLFAVSLALGPGYVSDRAPAGVGVILDIVSVLGVVVIVLLAFQSHGFGRFLSSPVMQWTGSRSFSIYLVHEPIIVSVAVATHADGPLPWLLWALGAVIAAFAVAEVFYRVVERPAHLLSRHLGKRFGRAQRERPAAVTSPH